MVLFETTFGKCSKERGVNVDLSTNYLGLQLKNPIFGVSSILSRNLDSLKQLQDSGVSAVVMYCLFEELIQSEQEEASHLLSEEQFPEAAGFFPEVIKPPYLKGEEYLHYLERVKAAVSIPIIGSLNATTPQGWVQYSKRMEAAGINAIELHLSWMPTDPNVTAETVEQTYVDIVRNVKEAVSIPISVKVGPSFSAFANMAKKLEEAGADALVLFHRFFAPDIDLEALEIGPDFQLSQSYEMRTPLFWIGILRGRIKANLAAAGGIHTAEDVIKLTMAGADVVMIASAILQRGAKHISRLLDDLSTWMKVHGYHSIAQMRGSMSYRCVAEPAKYERAHYLRYLKTLQRL